MMPPVLRLLVTLLTAFALCAPCAAIASSISDYRAISAPFFDSNGRQLHAIRSFFKNGVPHYLLLDPKTFSPTIAPSSTLTPVKVPETSRLQALLARTASPPFKLQNHGVTHALHPVAGVFLTVDLCPSKRPFEKGLFEALTAIARKNGKPVPVAICISGAWLANHQDELLWLKKLDRDGLLAITWVNHSLSHFYEPGLVLERNFMRADGTNQRGEILANEVAMIEANIIPSAFFRFPGLVSNDQLITLLSELFLIPLGADAWLAKGEEPQDGSIILVHGNGNEPPGIVKLMKLLHSPKPPVFLTLTEAVLSGHHERNH